MRFEEKIRDRDARVKSAAHSNNSMEYFVHEAVSKGCRETQCVAKPQHSKHGSRSCATL